MNTRIATSALVLALTLAVTGSSHAAGFPGFHGAKTTTATPPAAARLISFSMRNGSAATLVVQLGDQQISIEPGKTATLKGQNGQQIVAVNAAGHATAGSVLGIVNSTLQGNTLVVN